MDIEKWKSQIEKELKSCPFCDGYAKVEQIKGHLTFYTRCVTCGCTFDNTYHLDDKDKIIADWNRRYH